MRLHLSFTRRRSSSLSKPGRFENGLKSGAFSKRYGFIGRVNGETASIQKRSGAKLAGSRSKYMVNLARSAAFCCTINFNPRINFAFAAFVYFTLYKPRGIPQ